MENIVKLIASSLAHVFGTDLTVYMSVDRLDYSGDNDNYPDYKKGRITLKVKKLHIELSPTGDPLTSAFRPTEKLYKHYMNGSTREEKNSNG